MRHSAERLRAIGAAIIRAGGSTAEEARLVADHLVDANLAGHDSHGIGMIPAYVRHVLAKLVIPNTRVKTVKDDGPTLMFDGQRGYGRPAAGEATQTPPVWYDPRELKQVHVEKGNRVSMQANFFPLFDRAGKVSHVAVLFKDMTAETVHREELEAERELLSAVIDQVSEGIIMADAGGVIRLANRAARELGIRPGTPMEKWAELYDPRNEAGQKLSQEALPLARALRGETARVLLQRRGPDGSLRALNTVAVPLRRPTARPSGRGRRRSSVRGSGRPAAGRRAYRKRRRRRCGRSAAARRRRAQGT